MSKQKTPFFNPTCYEYCGVLGRINDVHTALQGNEKLDDDV